MSIAAPDQKRPWALLGVAGGVLLLLVSALILLELPGKQLLSPGDPGISTDQPDLPQAPWQIKIHPAGVVGKVSKAQGERIQRQRPQVASLVKRVYDAMLLHPGRMRTTLERNFTPAAAAALRRSGAAVPEAGIVGTTKRKAQIGIQASGGPTHAIATVSVRAGLVDRPEKVFSHTSTLWMERGKSGWKVVAFDVKQGPIEGDRTSKGKPAKGKRRK